MSAFYNNNSSYQGTGNNSSIGFPKNQPSLNLGQSLNMGYRGTSPINPGARGTGAL